VCYIFLRFYFNFFLEVFCKSGLGLVLALRFVLRLRWALLTATKIVVDVVFDGANIPNRYSALCWRPVMHAQTWASYSALYRFRRLSFDGTRK